MLKFILLAILSLSFIAIDHRLPKKTAPIRLWMETVLHPLRQVVHFPSISMIWIAERFTAKDTLQEENSSLKKRNLLLQQKLQKYGALEAENIRLRNLIDSSFRFEDDHILIAEILSVDLDPFNQEIVINKGSLEDAYVGQPILDATGVMGQIIRTTPTSSTVLLISSTRHAIPVQNQRNGLRTIVIGTGRSAKLTLRFLPLESDLEEGDILETSGFGGLFPPGYPVGIVASIRRDTDQPFAQVEIKPAASLERSQEVLLVWPFSSDNLPPDWEKP